MGKLLETRLPNVTGNEVTPEVFNRLVRILEINLSAFDPDSVRHCTNTELDELQFATGSIIFNSTTSVHQAFDGTNFRNLYEHQTYVSGISATMSLGTVSVTIG